MPFRRSVPSWFLLFALLAGLAPAAAQEEGRRSAVVRAVERVSPAVVNISAEAIVRAPDPFFGSLFGGRARRAQSLGSGLIVDAAGFVVTNAHVIEGASRIVVTTLDGRELEAEVLGSDQGADLALLKVAGRGLPAVPLGTSGDLLIGETVLAIGNPFGLSHTVTSGVLSARGRAVPAESGELVYTDFLQTDASINPGNSGGPLVNLAGSVIGINTAIVQGAHGIGFAIPADRARRVVEDLLRYGELQPLWTGLRLVTLDPEFARREGLPVARGAYVERVFPGSPAAAAGLVAGDIVVAVAGQPVLQREDVATAFSSAAPGTELPLEVRRGEAAHRLRLAAVRPPRDLGLALLAELVGIEVEAAPRQEGLVVARVAPRSPAARRGVEPGDLLLGAGGRKAAEPEALAREVLRALERGSLLLVVGRGRYAYNLTFPL
ncbi:MAG TPA: trypsin-like peptidase domain-containing protein [Thermoanaerobaculia bacterium]|nr:trypsin-like peptidase domain-containing protein [Thermoanaerobaculia bacterium]